MLLRPRRAPTSSACSMMIRPGRDAGGSLSNLQHQTEVPRLAKNHCQLQCKCYVGKQEKGHCPYYKNVADLRIPITQGSWAIKDYDCARLEQISRRQCNIHFRSKSRTPGGGL